MADIYGKTRRAEIMRRITSRNTRPEIRVRSVLHRMGFRFRIHAKDLPGKPDIVLPKWSTVIFVHGCFWHGHKECCEGHLPKSNQGYWSPKLKKNRERDAKREAELVKLGWNLVVIWECQTDSLKGIEEFLRHSLPQAMSSQLAKREAGSMIHRVEYD